MVTPTEALAIILEHSASLPFETIRHEQALGRTLARDVSASVELPPFDNSAMDGYAVVASDLQGASEDAPVRLPCLGTVGAGDIPQSPVAAGHCVKIMTGAPLPAGADAVVMREETRDDGSHIEFLASASEGQNIRRSGSDVTSGEVVLQAGTLVGAGQWALLAALGQARIEVVQRPKVGIIVTGAELAPVDQPLQPGQIRDSNSYALRAMVEGCGAQVTQLRHSGDEAHEFETILREVAQTCDVVITSGGVSAGDFDPVRDVLRDKGQVLFWKIAMKPGKPVMVAMYQNTPVFGLPGNPASVMVAFEEFARPALLKMGGRRALKRIEVEARLDDDLLSPNGRVEYVRAVLRHHQGEWLASVQGDQGSGRLSTFARANALLVVPAEKTRIEAGEFLTARLIDCPETEGSDS